MDGQIEITFEIKENWTPNQTFEKKKDPQKKEMTNQNQGGKAVGIDKQKLKTELSASRKLLPIFPGLKFLSLNILFKLPT